MTTATSDCTRPPLVRFLQVEVCPLCHGRGQLETHLGQGQTGRALRSYRRNNAVTQREIAKVLSFTHAAVSDWERGLVGWTIERVRAYLAAVDRIVADRERKEQKR